MKKWWKSCRVNTKRIDGQNQLWACDSFCFADAIKRRDTRLKDDEQAFEDTWQLVKESVRQLKQDHKRTTLWKTLREVQNQPKNPLEFPVIESNAVSASRIDNDENNDFDKNSNLCISLFASGQCWGLPLNICTRHFYLLLIKFHRSNTISPGNRKEIIMRNRGESKIPRIRQKSCFYCKGYADYCIFSLSVVGLVVESLWSQLRNFLSHDMTQERSQALA